MIKLILNKLYIIYYKEVKNKLPRFEKIDKNRVQCHDGRTPGCGHIWTPRVKKPKQCPYCHKYDERLKIKKKVRTTWNY